MGPFGAPGLIRAVEACFPRALRQRCLVHRMRNLRSKAPESQWPEIALRARGCYEAASPALAAVLRDDFVAAYERDLPAVVQCFRDDFERASPTSASRCAIGAWSAPPTCSSGSSWRSDVARRSSRTPSGSGRC
ncbi:MAG: hypothetical protein DMF98_26165 [Acidobacteria bacterium]|nr:MAG: hypothetical protein DMF98_26165 [Acidobacteriota bacterium]